MIRNGASSPQASTPAALRPAERGRRTGYERNGFSDSELSPPSEAPPLRPQSPGQQKQEEACVVAADPSESNEASADKLPHGGFRPRTRASATSLRVRTGVNSDENDMRTLFGDWLDICVTPVT